MDCSSPTPCLLLDESDEPRTPLRSPSRLDFCLKRPENGGVFPEGDDNMDLTCTPSRGDHPCTFNGGDALAVEVAPLDYSQFLVVEGDEDDPPQNRDSYSCQNADMPRTSSMPRERSMNPVVTEPRSPIPVRPLLVQFDFDAQEVVPPSSTAPQRLNYPHHGFSRSALLQQKTLWNSRHEEWVEWHSRMEQGEAQRQESDAYTGLATTQPHPVESPPRTPPSGLERDLADSPSKRHEQDVRASIFPRVGDISALRDPYSVNIDRRFFKFPLWTLHKMLYMFDMHQRSAPLTPSASVCNSAHVPASTSSITLSSYASSASGNEEPDPNFIADDRPSPASQLHLDPLKSASSSHCPSSWNRFCGWESTWYARWELLLSLFQRDRPKFDALDMSMKSTELHKARAAPLSPPEPTCHFDVGDDRGGNDEDEDYGMAVPDPFSSVDVDFDEECERALAFFRRESKHPEMAS